jgi:hypothetical protein
LGDTYLIDSDHPEVYAILRKSKNEVVMVIVNLGKDAVDAVHFNLASGPLAGHYRLLPMLGDVQLGDLSANPKGGFDNYQPLPSLPGYFRLVVQLQLMGQ